MTKAIDLGDFYKIPADNRNLNYDKYIEKGTKELIISESISFTQHSKT
jgi:UDP-N-acetylglucosamine 4,6-dehydratase/5-epimerase